ncbi:MAG: GntR family transcriptional regulator [Clostridia bacterium]|nr:GntR family transcriptional regulator [Clostridia bacterium]
MKPVNELPLYLKIADDLRAKLLLLPVGAPFTTEQALAEEYGVARGTIRQALNVLVQEGILTRAQGRGSFRSESDDSQYNVMLSKELTDSIRKFDENSSLRGLSITVINATPAIAELLNVPHNAKVRRVTRVRTVDGVPYAYCVAHLRTDTVPAFFKRDYKSSLGKLVRYDLMVHIESRHCDIYAIAADETVAQALSIPVGTPVMKIMLLVFGRDREPLLSDVFYFPSSQALHFEI